MRTTLLAGLACASLAFATADLHAHGGQYRGPGDIVPPNPGSGGGRPPTGGGPPTGGRGGGPIPSGPYTPGGGAGGPGTGGTGGPGPFPGPGPGTGGMPIPEDPARWEFWWEINKDPFLELKQAVHAAGPATGGELIWLGSGRVRGRDTMKPGASEILGRILPALARCLESSPERDITSACMVAMAKIGETTPEVDLLAMLRARLRENDQEIRETAALALGISQRPEAVDDLVALCRDDARGRQLVGRSSVDGRTRAFAAYGLGLIAWATPDLGVDRTAVDALVPVLGGDDTGVWDLRVAAIQAIGLIRPDPRTEAGRELIGRCLDALEGYWGEEVGVGQQLVQSHVPAAFVKLVGDVDLAAHPALQSRVDAFRDGLLDHVRGRGRRENPTIVQSAILALGQSTAPNAGSGATPERDLAISEALLEHFHRGKDAQARYFALIALGQIGGDGNRNALLHVLRTGSKALERPWAAIALGVLEFRARQAASLDDRRSRLVGDRLLEELRDHKNPSTIGAIAIGLGLAGHEPAADVLRATLADHAHQDELAGHLCIALALLGDRRAMPLCRNLVETSVRRPHRLQQAAIALGKLGDKAAALLLIDLLDDGGSNLAKLAAIATALGSIGDRRTIEPLIDTLEDEQLPALSRAFAAAALGGIADKELLPWNSKIGCNVNYRAAVGTLTNQVNGILDIL